MHELKLLYPIKKSILRFISNWTRVLEPDCIFFLWSSYDYRYALLLAIRLLEDCTEIILNILSWVFSLSPQKYLVASQLKPYCTSIYMFWSVYYTWQRFHQHSTWGQGFFCAYGIVASIQWLQQLTIMR